MKKENIFSIVNPAQNLQKTKQSLWLKNSPGHEELSCNVLNADY